MPDSSDSNGRRNGNGALLSSSILQTLGLIATVTGGVFAAFYNLIIAPLNQEIHDTVSKVAYQEYTTRTDNDLKDIHTYLQGIVPREEHVQRWQEEDKNFSEVNDRFSQLQKEIDKLSDSINNLMVKTTVNSNRIDAIGNQQKPNDRSQDFSPD